MHAPWFKLWLSWIDDPDFDELPLEAQAIVLRMWCVQWREGSVPGDTEELARKTKVRVADMEKHVEVVLQLFVPRGAGIHIYEPMESERQQSGLVSRARSNAAQKRWNKQVNALVSANGNGISAASADADEYRSRSKEVRSKEGRSNKQEGEKDSCGGTASAPPSHAPLPLLLELQVNPAVIALPCSSGPDFQVTEAHVAEFRGLYPAVDVLQEFRGMRGWLIANTKQRKTHGGMMRFINSWLSKEQDKPALRAASTGFGSYSTPVPAPSPVSAAPKAVPVLPADLNRTTGPKAWAVILEVLRKGIDPHSFGIWIQPLKGLGISKGTLYVRLPHPDFEIVSEQWGEQINAAAEAIGLSAVRFLSGDF
jgi:hypothetical protein